MGVKLQLVLGVVLVFSVCASPGSSNFRQIRQVSSDNSINATTPQDVALEKSDRHRNLIEKSPKTDTELKNINTNTQKNFTSIKLNKSEPYVIPPSPSEGDNSNTDNLQKNIVEKERIEENKENAIKKDTSEKKREENSRAIDIDITKYVSPEFHSKNNVFTMPIASDTEKYIEKIFEHRPAPQKLTDFSNLELTTPRNDFFDNKFKEAVQSIDQKLEHIDVDDNENDESPKELQVEKIIEEYRTTPNSNLDYKELKNVIQNNTVDKNSTHKDMTVEQVKIINFETSFNDTKVYNDEDDPEDKYIKGDSEKFEPTTPKNNFILTTRKSVTLTKPPSNRNNSHILSNKIETDILKAINVVTTELPTTKRPKGDDESSAASYENVPGDNSIIRSTDRPEKQIVEENRITTVHQTTTENYVGTATPDKVLNAANTEENLTPKITTVNSVDIDTTVDEELIRSSVETTARETTEDATSVTEEAVTDTITELVQQTEEVTTIDPKDSINTEHESVTTTREESVTSIKEDLILHETTYTTETGDETTTYVEGVVTTYTNDQTTETEIRTESGVRTSKGLGGFDYLTTTENVSEKTATPSGETMSDTTEYSMNVQASPRDTEKPNTNTSESSVTGVPTTKVPETATSSPEIIMHTSSIAITTVAPEISKKLTPSEEQATDEYVNETAVDTTTSKSSVTGVPTISKAVRVIIGNENVTSSPEVIVHTSPAVVEITTTSKGPSVVATKVTKKMITPDDEHANETIDSGDASPTTIRSANIDTDQVNSNHATFYPDTPNSSFSYPTPKIEVPTDTTNNGQTSTTINATTEDGDEGTEVSGTEEIVTDSPGDKKGTIAAIVISTVGAVCLVLLAGLLYIMRKRQKRFNYGQRCRPVSLDHYSMDNISVYNSVRRKGGLRASKRSYGNPAFDDPVAVTHPLNFPALAKFALNAEDIKAEFEEIPQIVARTSELPEGCDTKNRYANVIPLPESRVFLKAIDGYPNSDYINANYVTGPKNIKGYYIACQAPLQNTVDDFWRMVWEQQTKVILMITHLFENGVEKCVNYLPPSEVLDCHRLFGDFQITLKNREVKDKYIISSLQLKNMVSNSWREVTHFWYMGWPEKGVPSEANSLIAFLIEARSLMKSSTLDKDAASNGNIQNGTAHNEVNPVVVHCSPGTGRTGVVIACDIAIREFEQTRLVDIPKIVYRIRRDRASAVQTKEQYMFIYKVVSLYATKLTGGALDSF